MVNFTAADRVGGIGGYIGGITALLNMLGGSGMNFAGNGACGGGVNREIVDLSIDNAKLKSELDTERKINAAVSGLTDKLNDANVSIGILNSQMATFAGMTKTGINGSYVWDTTTATSTT